MPTTLLKNFITAVHPLNPGEREQISSIWQPCECKRKTVLTTAGETERHLYFVLEGVQRAFYIGDKQREATIDGPIS